MALLAILALLLIGNFGTTLKRGRDARRKNDLNQLQKALETYYEDNKTYPTFDIFSGPNRKFCKTISCSSGETVYMIKTPTDPISTYVYKYVPETPSGGVSVYYYLYSNIENSLDQGSGVSFTGFTDLTKCDIADIVSCKYYVSSSNAAPLTPNP